MKSIFKFAVFAVLIFTFSFAVSAQKTLKEGSIKYELVSTEPSSPEMDMMKGSRMELAFDKKNQKMEMSMMGGMIEIKTLTDVKSEEGVMLFNMMGNKIKVDLDKEDLDKKKEVVKKPNFEVTVDKSDTKEIIGYKCYKATLKDAEGNELVIYGTDEISTKLEYFNEMFPGFDAFPMEYSISNAGFSMVFSAIEFNKKLDKDAFDISTEGYTTMTMEEFEKQMGGMGGMGF